MSLTAQVRVSGVIHETSSTGPASSIRVTTLDGSVAFSDGSGANQAQVTWSESGSVSSAGTTFTLQTMSSSQRTVNFGSVKAILVKNTDATTGLVVGGLTASSHGMFPITTGLTLPPGGSYTFVAPNASGSTVSGSAYLGNLASASTATTASYSMVIIGNGTATPS